MSKILQDDDSKRLSKPPEPKPDEVGMEAVRKTISSVLPLSDAAMYLFGRVIPPAFERRQQEWMEEVAEAVGELQDRLEGFNPADLTNNEKFITAVTRASHIAVRTHLKEKREALKNAISNIVVAESFGDDQELVFLNAIEELTPSHINLRFSSFSIPLRTGLGSTGSCEIYPAELQ